MNDKTDKLKARLPRGLGDRGPAEIAATCRMLDAIRQVYERYGFEPVETPAIEYTDALGKFLPDQDRPNEGVFSFKDDDEQWLSLRYDLTAPLARYVAENFQHLAMPYRSYRYGWVFRNEKPGPGRFRQFMQFDADTVGSASMAADAEICMMAADTMEALGIERGQYVVKVNNRKVLDGVLEGLGVGGEINAGRRLGILRAVDKLDRLGVDAVRQLLGKGRKDESGDFTPGAELDEEQIRFVLRATAPPDPEFDPAAALLSPNIETNLSRFSNATFWEGATSLDEIRLFCESLGYGPDRIRIDQSVVRGLEYYTGYVYEVELLLETKDEKGRPVRFGSVGGGGRYDGLVSRFMGQPVPATGFSIGVSRLMAALAHLGKIETKPEPGPVVVTVFDRDRIADYQRMVSKLRDAEYAPGKKIRAEMYLGAGKFNPQMKYADKRGSPCVVIQGSDEKNNPAGPQVVIKDLILGSTLADTKDRDEYLRRQAEAQFAVAEDKLVEAVQSVLARHNIRWG